MTGQVQKKHRGFVAFILKKEDRFLLSIQAQIKTLWHRSTKGSLPWKTKHEQRMQYGYEFERTSVENPHEYFISRIDNFFNLEATDREILDLIFLKKHIINDKNFALRLTELDIDAVMLGSLVSQQAINQINFGGLMYWEYCPQNLKDE